jgi:hypothetical protein
MVQAQALPFMDGGQASACLRFERIRMGAANSSTGTLPAAPHPSLVWSACQALTFASVRLADVGKPQVRKQAVSKATGAKLHHIPQD